MGGLEQDTCGCLKSVLKSEDGTMIRLNLVSRYQRSLGEGSSD